MKKIVLIAFAAILMSACGYNTKVEFNYSNPERYSVGDAEIEQSVSKINVDWYSGEIVFRYADCTNIRISEESDSTLNDTFRMRHCVDDGGELDIQFCEMGKYRHGKLKGLQKRLYIDVPFDRTFDEIEINTVSGVLRIDSVLSRELSVNMVTTAFDAYYPVLPDEIEINSVNANITLHVPETAGMSIEMETVNSDLKCDLPMRKDNGKTIIGDGHCDMEVNAVNGSVIISVIPRQPLEQSNNQAIKQ